MAKASSGLAVSLLVIVPVIAIVGYLALAYNNVVDDEEAVFTAWSQVESSYQRRADLIPNLVKTVQTFADHEAAMITEVADKRAEALKSFARSANEAAAASDAATQSTLGSKEKLGDEQHMKQISQAQKTASDKLLAVMAMSEAYPNLRSSDSFLALQDQLEGTENRINMARMGFNQKAGDFNARIRRIPGSLLAGLGGFQRKAYFQADESANKVVPVNFGGNQPK